MVNVDTVYKTVLYILNKEQRGYITPDEFNRLGNQVQLEIFEQYFEELNQQLRIPENDSEYANRVKNLDEKIAIFETNGSLAYVGPHFTFPANTHRIGTLEYGEKELQRLQRNEYILINKSPLTKPTTEYPVYILEGIGSPTAAPTKTLIYPTEIISNVTVYYIRKPDSPVWGYTVDGGTGGYVYAGGSSTQFELHSSEETNIILQILMYAGVIIRDPQIVQTAARMVQQEEVNEKS
ncbi:MAG: hypothetical protein GY787_00480 [Alteromonadales bacterium]|nr:hypothetical protein [Alteromonadales bacterium]